MLNYNQNQISKLKTETFNLPGAKIGKTLEAIGLGKYFLNRIQVIQEIVLRSNKWDHNKLRGFCTTEKIHQVERLRMGRNFCQLFFRQRIIFRIHKELKILHSPKIKDPIYKWPSEINRYITTEVQMAN